VRGGVGQQGWQCGGTGDGVGYGCSCYVLYSLDGGGVKRYHVIVAMHCGLINHISLINHMILGLSHGLHNTVTLPLWHPLFEKAIRSDGHFLNPKRYNPPPSADKSTLYTLNAFRLLDPTPLPLDLRTGTDLEHDLRGALASCHCDLAFMVSLFLEGYKL
jgi:hypothetical protein